MPGASSIIIDVRAGTRVLKKAFLFFIFISVCFSVTAEQADKTSYNFSIGTSFGVLLGESEEIVFQDPYIDDYKSQLLWQLKPMMYAGLDFHFGWELKESESKVLARIFTDFFADVSLKFGIPGNSGLMEDRDWLDYNFDQLTHYSVHNNYLKNAVLSDISIGKAFSIHNKIRIKPFISYSYMYLSWEASGGSLLYPKYQDPPYSGIWQDGHKYLESSDAVISYEQKWHILSPGISLYGEFNDLFNIELFFRISPLVWIIAVDNHILRNTVFTDYIFPNLYFEPSLLFTFRTGSLFSLSLSYAYRNISHGRGDTKTEEAGREPTVSNNYAGAGYSVHSIGITAKFIFQTNNR